MRRLNPMDVPRRETLRVASVPGACGTMKRLAVSRATVEACETQRRLDSPAARLLERLANGPERRLERL
jgi:hypothetical protein